MELISYFGETLLLAHEVYLQCSHEQLFVNPNHVSQNFIDERKIDCQVFLVYFDKAADHSNHVDIEKFQQLFGLLNENGLYKKTALDCMRYKWGRDEITILLTQLGSALISTNLSRLTVGVQLTSHNEEEFRFMEGQFHVKSCLFGQNDLLTVQHFSLVRNVKLLRIEGVYGLIAQGVGNGKIFAVP